VEEDRLMQCPYGQEVGVPAQRGNCELRKGSSIATGQQCLCDRELALFIGSGERTEEQPEGVNTVTDPQTLAVAEWWINAEEQERQAMKNDLHSERSVV